MAKYRVAVIGSTGKSILIDTDSSTRLDAVEAAVTALQRTGVAAHRNLSGLQIGDDHPQYTMWQAPEQIKAAWNFVAEPSINGDLLTEFIQDKIGTILVDSTSIDFTYSDATPSITAAVIYANPSGLIGLTAANGTAATSTRSDARHALDQAIAPVWTGHHQFTASSRNLLDITAANMTYGNTTDVPLHRFYGVTVFDDHSVIDHATSPYLVLRAGALDHYLQIASPNFNFAAATGYGFTIAVDGDGSGVPSFSVTKSATADNIRMSVYDVTGASLKRVSRGAVDSGGVGFRLLRIPN